MVSKEQEERIIKETILLVNLFLETNESDIELANRTGISSSTVQRRLTNRERILEAFPYSGEKIWDVINTKREENLKNGKKLGGLRSIMKLYRSNGEEIGSVPQLKVEWLSSDEKKQLYYLRHLMLTFRAKPETISELFKIDADELVKKLALKNTDYNSLAYLYNNDTTDQELAKTGIIAWISDYHAKYEDKETERSVKKYLKESIADKKASEIIKRRNPSTYESREAINPEDLETMIKFQVKYALTQDKVCSLFNANRSEYSKKTVDTLEKNHDFNAPERFEGKEMPIIMIPSIKEQYEVLSDFNSQRRNTPSSFRP